MSKTDSVRRIARRGYWREADARVVVDAWRQSGDSLAEFGRRYGVRSRRIAWWAARLPEAGPVEFDFHPVKLTGELGRSQDEKLEVELRDGSVIRLPVGFSLEDLRRVLDALEWRERC